MQNLSRLDRAVYDIVRAGGLTAAHRPLYPRELARLAEAGLIRREGERFVDATAEPVEPEPSPPRTAALVVRVPVALIEALDAKGPTRSEATRQALAKALGVKLP